MDRYVALEEAEKKSGVESVLTRWNMSPHTPLTPCSPSPLPSLTSINHLHTVTHTLSITCWRHKHNSNGVKRQEHIYLNPHRCHQWLCDRATYCHCSQSDVERLVPLLGVETAMPQKFLMYLNCLFYAIIASFCSPVCVPQDLLKCFTIVWV